MSGAWQSYNDWSEVGKQCAGFASIFEQMLGGKTYAGTDASAFDFEQIRKAQSRAHGAPGEGTRPTGVVDEGLREKLELRRMGNICAWARDEGWTARLATNSRGYCVQFRGPQGEVVSGPRWEGSERRAWYVACERLAERAFNAEAQRGKGAERETK